MSPGRGKLGSALEKPRAGIIAGLRDGTASEVASSTFIVVSPASLEWQIVGKNGPTDPAAWQTATGFDAWSFGFDTATFGKGAHMVVVRVVYGAWRSPARPRRRGSGRCAPIPAAPRLARGAASLTFAR